VDEIFAFKFKRDVGAYYNEQKLRRNSVYNLEETKYR
jgi:hypothetical protein